MNIIAIKTKSQLFAIFFWLLLGISIFNTFRTISWAFHFCFSDDKQWKGLALRYFLNSFIPNGFFYNLLREVRKKDESSLPPLIIPGISLVAYFMKKETGWDFWSVVFWVTFIFTLIGYLLIYYEAGEEELGNKQYDEPIGLFKILGFCLAFWAFFVGVIYFKTIDNDTMPQYAETMVDLSKERIKNIFRPRKSHSSDYDDDYDDIYIHSHLGKE